MNTRTQRREHRPMRRLIPEPAPRHATAPAPAANTTASSVWMGLWFGLVTGLLEVFVLLAQHLWDHRVTIASIRTNHHWLWMVPVSDALILGSCGILLALLGRLCARPVARAAPYVFSFLAFFGLSLAIRGLYLIACVILALGLAVRTAPLIKAYATRFRRAVRWSTLFLAGIVAGLAGLVGTHVALAERHARATLPGARPGAPNILLIVMDDVRIDDLGVYGYQRDTTPNLARLASRAIRFDQARAPAPWTLPSHASMLTGRWPHELSVRVDQPLDTTFPTVAEFLARQGYATAGFVANTFYCNSWFGLDRGFAHYEDDYANSAVSLIEILRSSTLGVRLVEATGLEPAAPGEKSLRKTAAMINRDTLDWIDHRPDRPFFVFLNYYDAHIPFQPPAGFDVHFGLHAEPPAVREALLRSFARLGSRKVLPDNAPALIAKATQLLRDSYDTCIAYLDQQLGKLFAELEERGLLDNTLVIVTSDHGEQFNEHQLFGHGNSLYDALIRVPLLIVPPRARVEGRIVREPVSLRNLASTMSDVAGFGASSPFPGGSLTRFWAAGSDPAAMDDPVLAEVEHQKKYPPSANIPASLGPLQALVTGERVYIHNSDGHQELYDLERDPAELKNLAGAPDAGTLLEQFRRELARCLGD